MAQIFTGLPPIPSMKVKKRGQEHFITAFDLPAPGTFRWTQWQKSFFAKAIKHGLISQDEFIQRYQTHRAEPAVSLVPAQDGGVYEQTQGELKVDLLSKRITVDGELVSLTPLEYRLFEFLYFNAGKLVTKENLSHFLCGEKPQISWKLTWKLKDVLVCKVRKKLGTASGCIQTVWGIGYVFHL